MGGGGVSAFGAGYFDDAADVPGTPVLFFALRGNFRPDDATLELVKVAPVTPHPSHFSHRRPTPPHRHTALRCLSSLMLHPLSS